MASADSHYILIGFMASGKSTLGGKLAAWLGRPFMDTDAYLEQKAGQSIPDIFATYGEAHFRALESQVITDLQATLTEPHVIATGGGLPCRGDNLARLQQLGLTLFLDPPFETLYQRLLHLRKDRPMLSHYSDMELAAYMQTLLSERRPWYEQAHVHLPQAEPNQEDVFAALELAQ